MFRATRKKSPGTWVSGPAKAAVLIVRRPSSPRCKRLGGRGASLAGRLPDAACPHEPPESQDDDASRDLGDALGLVTAVVDGDAVEREQNDQAEGDREGQPGGDVGDHEPPRCASDRSA